MSEAYSIVFDSIAKAFNTMANFEILPGVSLLSFCIALLILHILISIIWIEVRAEYNYERTGYRMMRSKENRKNKK